MDILSKKLQFTDDDDSEFQGMSCYPFTNFQNKKGNVTPSTHLLSLPYAWIVL